MFLPVSKAVETMMIRVCGVIRVRGVRVFSSIRAASGPVRYNPSPENAKPSRKEAKEEEEDANVSHSRRLPRWKRGSKSNKEWGLGFQEEQKGHWDEQDKNDAATDDRSLASAEMQRLKAELKFRVSSTSQDAKARSPYSQKREKIQAIEEEEEEEPLSGVARVPAVGSGLFYGDGRKFEGLNSKRELPSLKQKKNVIQGPETFYGDGQKFEGLNSKREFPSLKQENVIRGAGLFYGDGRKFEGLAPEASDLFEARDSLFEVAESEEEKAVVKEKQAAKNYALRLLGIAPQTAHKLRQKLIGRSVSEPVIESTIADLQRCGLQSDLEYAEAFARSRWRSALWGPQRLKRELRQRGVSPEDITTALESAFTSTEGASQNKADDDDDDEESEALLFPGMPRDASGHLLEKARMQWARGGATVSAEAQKRRMVGWLQRRGFNWSVTSQVLKVLEAEEKNRNLMD